MGAQTGLFSYALSSELFHGTTVPTMPRIFIIGLLQKKIIDHCSLSLFSPFDRIIYWNRDVLQKDLEVTVVSISSHISTDAIFTYFTNSHGYSIKMTLFAIFNTFCLA